MSTQGALTDTTEPITRDGPPLLHRLTERVGVGAMLAALGFCCATALLGPVVVSGAVGAVAGVVTGIVIGSAWVLIALVGAGSVAAAWLVFRHGPPRP